MITEAQHWAYYTFLGPIFENAIFHNQMFLFFKKKKKSDHSITVQNPPPAM